MYSCHISSQNASNGVVFVLDHSYLSEIAVLNAPSSVTLKKIEMLAVVLLALHRYLSIFLLAMELKVAFICLT